MAQHDRPKLIPIAEWAAREFSPVPGRRNLCRWARSGRIFPAPQKVGRELWVRENAIYTQSAKTPKVAEVGELNTEDSVVNSIFLKRRGSPSY
jgi:hypothetical protein